MRNKLLKALGYKFVCKRCSATCITIHDLKCRMPDHRAAVPYEDGIKYEKTACPLEEV